MTSFHGDPMLSMRRFPGAVLFLPRTIRRTSTRSSRWLTADSRVLPSELPIFTADAGVYPRRAKSCRKERLKPSSRRCAASGVPVHPVNHLATMADLHRAGSYDRMSNDVFTLTGRGSLSVQEFVRKNSARFRASQERPEHPLATSISTGEPMNYGPQANRPHSMRRSFHEPSSFPVRCTCDIRS
jgi:hypothetical protein